MRNLIGIIIIGAIAFYFESDYCQMIVAEHKDQIIVLFLILINFSLLVIMHYLNDLVRDFKNYSRERRNL